MSGFDMSNGRFYAKPTTGALISWDASATGNVTPTVHMPYPVDRIPGLAPVGDQNVSLIGGFHVKKDDKCTAFALYNEAPATPGAVPPVGAAGGAALYDLCSHIGTPVGTGHQLVKFGSMTALVPSSPGPSPTPIDLFDSITWGGFPVGVGYQRQSVKPTAYISSSSTKQLISLNVEAVHTFPVTSPVNTPAYSNAQAVLAGPLSTYNCAPTGLESTSDGKYVLIACSAGGMLRWNPVLGDAGVTQVPIVSPDGEAPDGQFSALGGLFFDPTGTVLFMAVGNTGNKYNNVALAMTSTDGWATANPVMALRAECAPSTPLTAVSMDSGNLYGVCAGSPTFKVWTNVMARVTPAATVVSPTSPNLPYEAALVGDGHFFGYATCEWLRGAVTSGIPVPEKVGSACTVSSPGAVASATGEQNLKGYVYESDQGTLECGRLISTDDRNLVSPMRKTHGEVKRCPRGTPLTSLGTVVTKRLLVGGCMIASDLNYTAAAEVHVPAACWAPAEYWKGCMFPGATNYDPTAKQPADCHYLSYGCTDSLAVNFNPDAGLDDGTCIEAKPGCTIPNEGYHGVDPDTPGYKSRSYGTLARAANPTVTALPEYQSVLNYDSSANVLSGCVVAIEGCMDSTAANYDPAATVSSYTWCVPLVVGCMMPNGANPSLATGLTGYSDGRAEPSYQSFSTNYNPLATVHDMSLCKIYDKGCMDSTAHNYDPFATWPDTCYPTISGCLDPAALNYNCSVISSPIVRCTVESTYSYARPTVHDVTICKWLDATVFPSPPPPYARAPSNPGTTINTTNVVQVKIIVSGTVSDWDETTPDGLAKVNNLKDTYGAIFTPPISRDKITIEVSAGSVNVVASADVGDASNLESYTAQANSALGGTAQQASSVLGVQVINNPVAIGTQSYSILAPPSAPYVATVTVAAAASEDDSTGAIIGGIVGGLGGVALIGGAVYYMKKRAAAKVAA